MEKDHWNSDRGNPLPVQHALHFSISSKGYFICIIPQTGWHILRHLLYQSWSIGAIMRDRSDDLLHHERALYHGATRDKRTSPRQYHVRRMQAKPSPLGEERGGQIFPRMKIDYNQDWLLKSSSSNHPSSGFFWWVFFFFLFINIFSINYILQRISNINMWRQRVSEWSFTICLTPCNRK